MPSLLRSWFLRKQWQPVVGLLAVHVSVTAYCTLQDYILYVAWEYLHRACVLGLCRLRWLRVIVAGGGSTPSPSSSADDSAGAGGRKGTSAGLRPFGANANPLGTPNLFAGIAAAKPGH